MVRNMEGKEKVDDGQPASLRTNLMLACDGVAVVVDAGKVSDIPAHM